MEFGLWYKIVERGF